MSLKTKNLMAEFSRERCRWESDTGQGNTGIAFQLGGGKVSRRNPSEWCLPLPFILPPLPCDLLLVRQRQSALMENCMSLGFKSPFSGFLFFLSPRPSVGLSSMCSADVLARGWAYGNARATFTGRFAKQRISDQNP